MSDTTQVWVGTTKYRHILNLCELNSSFYYTIMIHGHFEQQEGCKLPLLNCKVHHHIHKDLPNLHTEPITYFMTVSDIMPNTLVDTHQRFGGTHCLHLQDKTFYTLQMSTVGNCKMLVSIHQTELHDMLDAHNLSIHYSANFRSQLKGGKYIFLSKNLTHMKQYEN